MEYIESTESPRQKSPGSLSRLSLRALALSAGLLYGYHLGYHVSNIHTLDSISSMVNYIEVNSNDETFKQTLVLAIPNDINFDPACKDRVKILNEIREELGEQRKIELRKAFLLGY